MADNDDQKLTPFQRAARQAAAAAAAARPVASGGARTVGPTAPGGEGRTVFGGGNQAETRAPFLATEAAQYLAAQRARMESARLAAERQRLHLEVERHKSHIFIKKQELARVAARLRSAESALVAAEADERRAKGGLGASAGAIHEKTSQRDRLAIDREAAERDFERREVGEAKAVEALEREIDKLVKRVGFAAHVSPQYRELERKKKDRERGLQSIKLERGRRRAEAVARDAALARQVAGAERADLAARRALDFADSMVGKYRLQVRAFSVAKQALDSDIERLDRELRNAEAAYARAAAPRPSTRG
jgi:hypothetical protein